MLGKLFKKQEEAVSIAAPGSGEVTALPGVFGKMMGDGIAVKPAIGEIVAPVDEILPVK
ncbi:PTS glucose transporter subunit IIA [Lentibacillus sediminis]|uniref:PTS glucose transporter subunit IIA n=1 Tax=Lentibacillus sediminis TaxID=1940529 RepID=UPI00117AC6CF|nr:PTS glucose transporter subunit IIA [Lentibacillus sediminis]